MYRSDYENRQDLRMEKLDQYTVLTPQDVMDILGIGKNSAYELLKSGQLKGFRVGRSWRVPVKALEDFMYSRRQ